MSQEDESQEPEKKFSEKAKEKAVLVKQHVVKHKTKYLVGGTAVSCLTIGGAIGAALTGADIKQTVDSLKLLHIQYKSPNVNVALVKSACPDPIPVRHKPTGEDFRSIRRAAEVLKMNARNISKDAHGAQEVFERLPDSVFA